MMITKYSTSEESPRNYFGVRWPLYYMYSYTVVLYLHSYFSFCVILREQLRSSSRVTRTLTIKIQNKFTLNTSKKVNERETEMHQSSQSLCLKNV